MPLNLALIGAVSTAAGGAAVTALPIHIALQSAGSALIVIGTMIMTRHHVLVSVHPKLDRISAEAKRSSDLHREQAELLHMRKSVEDSGPHTLPPPPLRRIS